MLDNDRNTVLNKFVEDTELFPLKQAFKIEKHLKRISFCIFMTNIINYFIFSIIRTNIHLIFLRFRNL